MKKSAVILAVTIVLIMAFSPVFAEETKIEEKVISVQKCDTPFAKIAIGKITCKAASCKNPRDPSSSFLQQIISLAGTPSFDGVGDGIGDMLLTALKTTGCFEILDREQMDEIKQELALLGKEVKLEAADFLIGGSITSLNMESSNTNLGGGIIPVLSLFNIKKTKAIIGMDIKVIDVETGKISFSKSYEANNSKTAFAAGAGTAFNGIGFGGAYSNLKGSALEDIVRDVVIHATIDIVNARDTLKAQRVSLSSSPDMKNAGSLSKMSESQH